MSEYDFQGFGEGFVPPDVFQDAEPVVHSVPKEVQEEYARMNKRITRVRFAIQQRGRDASHALRSEEEVLRANLARFSARWGFTG